LDVLAAESAPVTPDAARAQVVRIVASETFRGAQRAIGLLQFIVDETLAGRAATLKEFTLGAEALGRGGSFDPRTDPIARVEASRLRSRLDLYYAREGTADPVQIALPKGSYVPVFTQRAPVPELPPAPSASQAPAGKRARLLAAALVALVVGVVGVLYWRSAGDVIPQSIAVLPFTAAPADEYIAEGLTDVLINKLSRLEQVRVTARSVALSTRGSSAHPHVLGRQLNVATVITGHVSVHADGLTIQVDVVDSGTGAQVWGERYDRRAADLLVVQEEIAHQIADALQVPITRRERRGLAKRYTESAQAYQLYLQGLYLSSKPSRDGIARSIELYRRAIEIDPRFAPAYVRLATGYVLLSGNEGPSRWMPLARESVMKAIEIDPELADAHAELGFIRWIYDLDQSGAEDSFERALALDPSSAVVHYNYSRMLAESGRFDEALAEAQRALELDPLSMQIRKRLPYVLFLARRYDEAIAEYLKLIELAPDFVQTQRELGLVYEQTGQHALALRQFEKMRAMPENYVPTMVQADIAHLHALAGNEAEARRMLAALIEASEQSFVSAYEIAAIHTALADVEQALVWLEKAVEQRPFFIGWIGVDPRLDALRADPRGAALVKRALRGDQAR
jgi:TolB-like protein/Flp pilus assembly protein TadD